MRSWRFAFGKDDLSRYAITLVSSGLDNLVIHIAKSVSGTLKSDVASSNPCEAKKCLETQAGWGG